MLGNPKGSSILYNKIVVIDSNVGIGLKMINKNIDQTATIKSSFISAIYRPQCKNCYGEFLNNCLNMTGVMMLVST